MSVIELGKQDGQLASGSVGEIGATGSRVRSRIVASSVAGVQIRCSKAVRTRACRWSQALSLRPLAKLCVCRSCSALILFGCDLREL